MTETYYHPDKMIFVFGSNLKGRHGKGAALYARDWCGAEQGVGHGPMGTCYAIPTKTDGEVGPEYVMPIEQIREYVQTFIQYAKENADKIFMVTRIGCGLSGYTDDQIEPLFRDVPDNCLLPGLWLRIQNPKLVRLIVAGGRDYPRKLVKQAVDHLNWKTERLFQDGYEITEVCGKATGADAVGQFWADTKRIHVAAFPAKWDIYSKKSAGPIRNSWMAWYSTHLIPLWDGQSRGTSSMIKIATDANLNVGKPFLYQPIPKEQAIGDMAKFIYNPKNGPDYIMSELGITGQQIPNI